MFRLIVSDTEKVAQILKCKKYICKTTPVIGLELEDIPGAMESLLKVFEEMNINIDYVYVGFYRENNAPIIILHCDDVETVSNTLKYKGYKVY